MLSVMWVNQWENIKSTSFEMNWWTIFLLFLFSLLTYATSFASNFPDTYFSQAFYGLIVLFITIAFYSLDKATEKKKIPVPRPSKEFRRAEYIDYI
ncbi:hypothetical protein EX290_14075 [Enterococcus faecium]|uniref:hypothetical protein n=3 Tax=Enterococcus TaxID=1350 RepID=UPI001368DF06|nr:hypothetical protein [Enterococcus faecalis]NAL99591.1 hypothetical protein [Enterococcus faecium]NAM13119.1 hypothetical protein [Enterococcus faecium]NAM28479.1 hypothetical protein [Enterococcus faecium]NAM36309.1 hypothetical protein [Enterococcus faecium]NAM44487.1 hypothetical protein [Enterococcus faecium]